MESKNIQNLSQKISKDFNDTPKVNAVIYSRVSSESDRQDNQRQTSELLEYANRMGYNIVNIYEEKVSGLKMNSEKPIFSKMLDDIDNSIITNECKIEKILVWELSRIGRNVLQSLQNIQLLTDKKVGLYIKNFNLETLNEDYSPNSLSMFMVQILFSVANMELQMTKNRMVSGYKNHIEKYGTKSVGRKIGQVQVEAKTLERHGDVLKLLRKGHSIRDIACITKKSVNTVLKVKKLLIQ
ncbi:MAG: recombinase family protein [Chitinophagaceae bacterium]|nr:recombinase family protein [Chitinophagaceae bacterium]